MNDQNLPLIGSDQTSATLEAQINEHNAIRRARVAEEFRKRRQTVRTLVWIGAAYVVAVVGFLAYALLTR